jgi:hypothetical protein
VPKVTLNVTPFKRYNNLRSTFIKNGGVINYSQDLDHTMDLQLGGSNELINLSGLDRSVNRSFGPQIYNQIRDLPDNTRINQVAIDPFTKK